MGDREVKIKWTGPFCPEEAERGKEKIYQLCGYHPVYGENVLLYIFGDDDKYFRHGKTISAHKWTDKEEVPRHFKPEQITVAVGEISDNDKKKVPLETIKEMLVFMHSPAWNFYRIRNIGVFCKEVVIENEGKKGGLLREIRGKDCYVE